MVFWEERYGSFHSFVQTQGENGPVDLGAIEDSRDAPGNRRAEGCCSQRGGTANGAG